MGCRQSVAKRPVAPQEAAVAAAAQYGESGKFGEHCNASSAAAMEFTMRISAKKKVHNAGNNTPHAGEHRATRGKVRWVSTKKDFAASHRELLGRFWETHDMERLSKLLVRNAPVSLQETKTSASFAWTSTQREDGSSMTFFSPNAITVSSLAPLDGRRTRSARRKRALPHHSRWVSLLHTLSELHLEDGETGERVPTSCAPAHAREGAGACKLSGMRGHTHPLSRSGSPNDADVGSCSAHVDHGAATGCGYPGAKKLFAFRLSEMPSTGKGTSFLRKRKMYPCMGVHAQRWDRVEFFSPNIHSIAIAVAQTQPNSSNSFFTNVTSSGSPLSRLKESHATFNASFDTNKVLAPVLLTESLSSTVSQISLGSPRNAEHPTRFPESSLYCHCLALPASHLQELQAGGELIPTSFLSPFASTSFGGNALEKTTVDMDGSPLHGATICSVNANTTLNNNNNNKGASTANIEANVPRASVYGTQGKMELQKLNLRVRELSSAIDEKKKASPLREDTGVHTTNMCSSSELQQSHAPKTILSGIIVSSFDLSIDPFRWREEQYKCNTIKYNGTRSCVREQFREGIVTRVMYGGVFVVECTGHLALQKLEKALKLKKWSGRKKKMSALSKITTFPRDHNSNHVRDGAGRVTSSSCYNSGMECSNGGSFLEYESCNDANQLELYRVAYCVGGMQIKWESYPKTEEQSPRSDMIGTHTGCPTLTPWINLKTVMKLAHSWARHLLSTPELAEPLAVYVQSFVGIIPALRLVSDWNCQLMQLFTESEDQEDDDDDDDELSTDCGAGIERGGLPGMENNFGEASSFEDSSDLSTKTGGGLSVPTVLFTCRPMTQYFKSDGHVSKSTLRSSANISLITSKRTSDTARRPSSIESLQKHPRAERSRRVTARAIDESVPKVDQCTSSARQREGGFLTQRARGDNPHVPRTAKPNEKKEGTNERNVPVTDPMMNEEAKLEFLTPYLPPPLSFEGKDGEAFWERAMLEAMALEKELKDVMDARRKADDEFYRLGGIIHSLQCAFLPNSQLGEIEPLCAYLQTAIDDPMELPHRCCYFAGPDWFSCLAAVLTNPRNSIAAVDISYRLTFSSFPQLGMLAGLLFHECAMPCLQRLSLQCRRIFFLKCVERNELNRNEKVGKLWSRIISRHVPKKDHERRPEFSRPTSIGFDEPRRGPPFFLTPKQAKRVLVILTESLLDNARQSHFTLQLREFPYKSFERDSKVFHKVFHVFSSNFMRHATSNDNNNNNNNSHPHHHDTDGAGRKTKKNKNRPEEENALLRDRESTTSSWTDPPEVVFGNDPHPIQCAWNEAERQPHCMLMRHREFLPTRWSAHHKNHPYAGRHEEKNQNHSSCYEEMWVYGLGSEYLEFAVFCELGAQLLEKAPEIFDAVQAALSHRGAGKGTKKWSNGGKLLAQTEFLLTC
ncbi:hypothetical protein BCY84_15985 [Trypanosoma cruzi cruzi]|nr:hypothetical protein BCY84_15985 [Trypanosoma cruzi cruzi]